MGVRKLFSREGKKFPGGVKTYFLPKKQHKINYFSQKSLKTYYFWPAFAGQGGGQEPPLPPSSGRPYIYLLINHARTGRYHAFFYQAEI
jgi:hypothetical protein